MTDAPEPKRKRTPSAGQGSGGRVEQLIKAFRQAMLAQDAETMERLAREWLTVERRLEAQFRTLALETAEMRARGEPVYASKLLELERYRSLLGQARAEVSRYQRWSAEEIAKRQRQSAKNGMTEARELIRASYLEAGKAVGRFDLLPVEAVEAMIGYAGNGTPLYDLLMASYPDTIEGLTEALVSATARGENPRRTAQMMAEAMGGNLQRALVVSRTEQIRAYRRASTEQMRASGVVEGWIWRAALQERSCLACLAMDGTFHDLDEELDDHPNGRCFKQPKIAGLEPYKAQSGAEWFETLDVEKQRELMGATRFEAWKAGQFQFSDLAGRKQSDEWGSHVHVATLSDLGVIASEGEG